MSTAHFAGSRLDTTCGAGGDSRYKIGARAPSTCGRIGDYRGFGGGRWRLFGARGGRAGSDTLAEVANGADDGRGVHTTCVYDAEDGSLLDGIRLGALAAVVAVDAADLAGGRLDTASGAGRDGRDLVGTRVVAAAGRGRCHHGGGRV